MVDRFDHMGLVRQRGDIVDFFNMAGSVVVYSKISTY